MLISGGVAEPRGLVRQAGVAASASVPISTAAARYLMCSRNLVERDVELLDPAADLHAVLAQMSRDGGDVSSVLPQQLAQLVAAHELLRSEPAACPSGTLDRSRLTDRMRQMLDLDARAAERQRRAQA